jgi:predicted site-specific integrase-resolvase
MKTKTELPRYVRAREAQHVLGDISRETLRALVRDGIIDPPVQLSSKLHLFELAAIMAAVKRRAGKVGASV